METFYFLCMDQRLFTQFVLGILARELLFEFWTGFTPEERQVLSLTRFPSSAKIDVYFHSRTSYALAPKSRT